MSNFADCSLRNSEITATLVWILPDMSGQRYGFLVLGDDPAHGTATGHSAFQFVETHPSFTTAGVKPFDKHQLPIGSGHLNACKRVLQRQLHSVRCGFDHTAIVEQPSLQHVLMCVHISYRHLYYNSRVMATKSVFSRHAIQSPKSENKPVDFKLGHYRSSINLDSPFRNALAWP